MLTIQDDRPTEAETYGIAGPEEPPRNDAGTTPRVVSMHCPHCGGELTPELHERSWKTTCPECLEVVIVPAAEEWRRSRSKRRKKRRRSSANPAETSASRFDAFESLDDDVQARGVDEASEIRSEPLPPIPEWTFFSGVFSLPWQREVLSRWIYTSIGCCVVGLTVAVMNWLVVEGFLIAIPFFALPCIWLTLWTGSFAASSFLTVVEDTAAGNDRINGWNDGGWKDWMAEAMGVVFLAAVVCTAGYGAAKLATLWLETQWFRPVFWAVVFFTFPVVLISSLQAGSVFIPVTWPVLASLSRKLWVWAVYYLLSSAVAAVWLLPVMAGLRAGRWFLTLGLSGPVLAAAVLIEARLLGRLAWRALVYAPETEPRTAGRADELRTE